MRNDPAVLVIRAIPTLSQDLKPGDLFSTAPQSYWTTFRDPTSVGERVYIRTEAPCPDDERDQPLFHILVEVPNDRKP